MKTHAAHPHTHLIHLIYKLFLYIQAQPRQTGATLVINNWLCSCQSLSTSSITTGNSESHLAFNQNKTPFTGKTTIVYLFLYLLSVHVGMYCTKYRVITVVIGRHFTIHTYLLLWINCRSRQWNPAESLCYCPALITSSETCSHCRHDQVNVSQFQEKATSDSISVQLGGKWNRGGSRVLTPGCPEWWIPHWG